MSAPESTAHGRPLGSGPEGSDDLAGVVRELSDRIEALQADVRRLGGPGLPTAEPGWNDESAAPADAPSYAWISSIGAPVRRRPAVPRLLLEVLFLAGVAVAAALAELDAGAIAAVMAAAWLLVGLIEWAATAAERRRDLVPLLEPIAPAEPHAADPAWFVAPVQHTMIEPALDAPTTVTKLPPAVPDLDATVERPPDA